MRSWREHHPEWTVRLWDERSVSALVNESYSWFAPTFHALPSKIQQADAARYVILHAVGGLYADLDVECFKSFAAIMCEQSKLEPALAQGSGRARQRPGDGTNRFSRTGLTCCSGAKTTQGAMQLFEEPASHWEAHGTVVSNGLMGAPQGHPLLLKLLRSITPVAKVFASTGSHMLQATPR